MSASIPGPNVAAEWAARFRAAPLPERPLASRAVADPSTLRLSRTEEIVRERVRGFLVSESFEPPPLPAIAREILDACAAGDAAATQLAEIAHRDSFIAGRVLKLSNSAWYRRGGESRTLKQAIVRVGQNELRNVVLAVVLKGRTFDLPAARDFALLTWRHSLATALGASLAASDTGWVEPHRAFLAGLLHDVGKAVVLHAFVQLRRPTGSDPPALEHAPAVAHSLHTEVGSLLADAWRLDSALREVIARHHEPSRAAVDEHLCNLVSFADALVAEVGLGDEPQLPDITTHPVGLFMGYTEDRIWGLLDRIVQLMAQYDVV